MKKQYYPSTELKNASKIVRYKPVAQNLAVLANDDPMPEYMNMLGMIFSVCGLMFRMKFCSWLALLSSCVCFANSRSSDDTRQIVSSFMLSISAVVMSYLQNPSPIEPFWKS
ncbi:Protein Asterix [Strongyloides ratti]|uniref:Protein Asterix n=1 Tax=Strongyloides ratti TaxID=34506 RepID=A0A090MN02_STRRB|nr:Protein Asterix [Strongyloides ratti]CEF59421.1 Protein Asterix [Strongyloides ratti]